MSKCTIFEDIKVSAPHDAEFDTLIIQTTGHRSMGAFGDNLRREREMRGVALAEMSESTKISRRWLQALEDEEFTELPGGVFNRGFVRAYAHFLGINEEEAVADYIAASGEKPPPEDKFPLEIHEKPKAELNPKRSVLPVVLAVLGLVLAVGGWTWWIKHKSVESSARLVPSTESANFQSQEADQAVPQKAPRNRTQGASKQVAGNQAKRNREPADDRANTMNGSESSADSGGSFSVVIKAKANSWVSIAADGQSVWKGTLTPNDERSVTADKELVLKTGNAAGIEVSYNGKALGTLGKDKEVRTLTFNTAGLLQEQ